MIKDLGQNFLVDREVLQDIVAAAELTRDDVVLEVGPGKGVLTEELAKRVQRVVAVELDRTLVAMLTKKFRAQKNVEIVHADFLRWWKDWQQIPTDSSSLRSAPPRVASLHSGLAPADNHRPTMPARPSYAAREESRQGICREYGKFKVVANLPYGITSRVLRLFLEQDPRPQLLVVMVQKEVAQRICAKPGQMSLLSVSVQFYAHPEIIRIVPRTAFDPVPNVDSAVVRIQPHPLPLLEGEGESKNFFRLVKLGFSSRRKQLQNLLASGLHITNDEAKKALQAIGLSSNVRAQELSVEAWIALTRKFFSA